MLILRMENWKSCSLHTQLRRDAMKFWSSWGGGAILVNYLRLYQCDSAALKNWELHCCIQPALPTAGKSREAEFSIWYARWLHTYRLPGKRNDHCPSCMQLQSSFVRIQNFLQTWSQLSVTFDTNLNSSLWVIVVYHYHYFLRIMTLWWMAVFL